VDISVRYATNIMADGCKCSADQINLAFARSDRAAEIQRIASRMCIKRLPEALENQNDRCNT
jgi:hypothetical protein